MSSFLAIKKVFDLSASNDAQMLVSRQSRELSASSNDIVTTMKKHFDYTVDVSFDAAGGTACASSTYVLGKQYQDLPTTTRSSYIFQGWFTQLTGGIQISAESAVELSTTTLYAQWKYADVGDDYTEYVVQTTSSYKKTGIYSATRYSSSSPIVVDWGDGNVEAIEGNISQLAHEYSSVGVFHVKISNISNFAASANNSTWYGTTSQNRYTFKDVVKTGSKCTTMPNAAFYYCSALSSISFLNSCFTGLTSIPPSAFYYCTSITTNLSSLPARIKTLGDSAFGYCTGLTGIQDLRNTGLTSFTNTHIFANCTRVKEFKLPDNIGTTAGSYLFYYDTGLSTIQIPPSLTAVPSYMAYRCTGLKNIAVPSNIKRINTYSFRECTNLSSVTYETTALTAIGTYAFYQNYALQDLNVPDTVKSIENYAFYYCYNTHASALTLPSALTSLGTNAYQYCYNLKTLEIPSSLTSIGNTAFSGCRSLSSITNYRLTAQTIGANTFGSATGTNYLAYTGYSTHGSNKLYIYSAATGYDTSYWLDPLQNASKCGFSIEYIDQQLTCTVTLNAGDGSVSPASIDYVYGATMSTLPTPTPPNGKTFTGWNTSSDGSGTTYTTSSTAPSQATLVLYAIYSGDQPAYHADTWYKYAGDTGWRTVNITGEIRGGKTPGTPTTQIPDVTNVIALEIGSDVTSIGGGAFYECSRLTSVMIGNSVTSIGYAFGDCYELTSVVFKGKTLDQVEEMEYYPWGIDNTNIINVV